MPLAGANIVRISFRNQGEGMTEMPNGEGKALHRGCWSPEVAALAMSTAKPTPPALGLAPLAAAGRPGCEFSAINGIFAPARTPAPAVRRWNQEIMRYTQSPAAGERLMSNGSCAVRGKPRGTRHPSVLHRQGRQSRQRGQGCGNPCELIRYR